MTLSSMVVSRDWQEVSVLECILGSLHIGVDIEPEPERALAKLSKSKIDALIVDCDLKGTTGFLRQLQEPSQTPRSIPLVILSGSPGRKSSEKEAAVFSFEKPVSVEQAVRTLSAARNLILNGRLRYHRQILRVPVSLKYGSAKPLSAVLTNLSQGGMGIHLNHSVEVSGPIKIIFELPGAKRPVKAQGEIAWTDAIGNAGIRFSHISPRLQRSLQLWLERQYFSS